MTYLFDKYQLDAENFSLTRQGERIALEPKALRVLLLFVRNPGKLLEKNAIIQAVWPDTFVEESTLSRAVALVRKQLGDDPRRPVFIETVPTLGYRFIPSVETKSPVLDDPKAAASVDEIPSPRRLWSKRLSLWAAIAAFVLIAAGVWIRLAVDRRQALRGKRTIVLADFANTTGDLVFDTTLRQGMMVELEQSPVLTVVSEQRIQQTLRFMNRPADTRMTLPLAREVCERTGGAAVLAGSIASLGQHYIIGLEATNCASGETIDTEQVEAGRKEDVLQALGKMATGFRTRVGESVESMSAHDTPLTEATTSSLEALKAFAEANRVDLSNGIAAIPLFQRAIAIDPSFAMAHVMLGRLYSDVGQGVLSATSTSEAFRLRERASDPERFFIEVSYEMQVTGSMEKALEICETWAQAYPRDPAPLALAAGTMLRVFGRYEAKKHAAASIALSDGRDSEFGASFAFALARDSARAKSLAEDLGKRFPEDTNVRFHYLPPVRALLALNENQAERAVEVLQASAPYELGSPPSSFYSGFYGALYAVYVRGCAYLALHRGTEAISEFRKIIDHPGITGSDPVAALAQLQIARAYAQSGDHLMAKGCYTRFLRLWNTADQDVPIFKMAQSEMAGLK